MHRDHTVQRNTHPGENRMGLPRKLKCSCGGTYREQSVVFEGCTVEAMVCSRCSDETFTIEQSKKLFALAQMKKVLDKERKIIRIGDSIAITLPKAFEEQGWRVGKAVHLEYLTKKSLKIEVT